MQRQPSGLSTAKTLLSVFALKASPYNVEGHCTVLLKMIVSHPVPEVGRALLLVLFNTHHC